MSLFNLKACLVMFYATEVHAFLQSVRPSTVFLVLLLNSEVFVVIVEGIFTYFFSFRIYLV